MQENYGALSRVNPTQPIYAEDGKTQIGFTGTPRGRRLRDLGIDPQNYARFARQGGTNFFEYYDKPSYDYLYSKDSNETQKPEGFDDPFSDDGPTPEEIAAGIGNTIAPLAGNIGAASAASGGLSPTNLLAGIPYIGTGAAAKQVMAGNRPVFLDHDGTQTFELSSKVDGKGQLVAHEKMMTKQTPFQEQREAASSSLSDARNTVRMGGYDGAGNPYITTPGYLGRVGNRLNPLSAAGRINYTTSMYAGGANALTQMALGVKPKKAIESAFKTESVRLGVTALTGNAIIGNVASLVAAPILKGVKKFACKTGIGKLWSREARRGNCA